MPDYWQSVAGVALQAHALLAPSVPLVGWDVALAADGDAAAAVGGVRGDGGGAGDGGVGVGGGNGGGLGGGGLGGSARGVPYLLELNASCNLFNGRYDREGYCDLLYAYFAELGRAEEEEEERAAAAAAAAKKKRR